MRYVPLGRAVVLERAVHVRNRRHTSHRVAMVPRGMGWSVEWDCEGGYCPSHVTVELKPRSRGMVHELHRVLDACTRGACAATTTPGAHARTPLHYSSPQP